MEVIQGPTFPPHIIQAHAEAVARVRTQLAALRHELTLNDEQLQKDLDAALGLFGPGDVTEYREHVRRCIQANERWLKINEGDE
jgi:hypothetical protein